MRLSKAEERRAALEYIVAWLLDEEKQRRRNVEMAPGTVGDAYRRELLRLTRRALAAVRAE